MHTSANVDTHPQEHKRAPGLRGRPLLRIHDIFARTEMSNDDIISGNQRPHPRTTSTVIVSYPPTTYSWKKLQYFSKELASSDSSISIPHSTWCRGRCTRTTIFFSSIRQIRVPVGAAEEVFETTWGLNCPSNKSPYLRHITNSRFVISTHALPLRPTLPTQAGGSEAIEVFCSQPAQGRHRRGPALFRK